MTGCRIGGLKKGKPKQQCFGFPFWGVLMTTGTIIPDALDESIRMMMGLTCFSTGSNMVQLFILSSTVEPLVGEYHAFTRRSQLRQNEGLNTHSSAAPADDPQSFFFHNSDVNHDGEVNVLAGNLNAESVDVGTETSETTGFSGHWDDMALKVFPNPASDRLGVEFRHPGGSVVNIHLLHVDGRLLQSKRIGKKGYVQLHFDLSSYDAGIYLLRLDHDRHSVVKRIVLQ